MGACYTSDSTRVPDPTACCWVWGVRGRAPAPLPRSWFRAVCPSQELLEHGVCEEVERVRHSERYRSMKVRMAGGGARREPQPLFPRGTPLFMQHWGCEPCWQAPPWGQKRSLRKWQLTPDTYRQPTRAARRSLFF